MDLNLGFRFLGRGLDSTENQYFYYEYLEDHGT